jgi:hypothetical protein
MNAAVSVSLRAESAPRAAINRASGRLRNDIHSLKGGGNFPTTFRLALAPSPLRLGSGLCHCPEFLSHRQIRSCLG